MYTEKQLLLALETLRVNNLRGVEVRFSDILPTLGLTFNSELFVEKKWKEYRLLTNNEDAWRFKEWLKKEKIE